jgi:deoxyribose-phosphate aldolase
MSSSDATIAEIARLVDHTLLAADAAASAVEQLCREAMDLGCYSVCINSSRLPLAVGFIGGATVKACAVVGFPLGAAATAAKRDEAAWCVAEGASEIDMVMNLGWFRDGDLAAVARDVEAVKASCGADVVLKVILESALWPPTEISSASRLVVSAGADFVKTSTGFNAAGGASAEAVRTIRGAVGDAVGVKASGGIRDLSTARAMLEAGASRLGMSNTAVALTHA